MTRIDAVLLDAGGVLLLPEPGVVATALPDAAGLDAEAFDRAHYAGAAALVEFPADNDRGVWDAYLGAYLRALGSPDDAEAMDALARAFREPDAWARVAPGAADGLRALAATAVALAVVSNSDGTVTAQLQELGLCQQGPGPYAEVAAVIDSHVVGVAKPHPAIFALALDALGVPPERAVHVGDVVGADVEGARAAGVRPLHFDPFRLCPLGGHEHVASLTQVAALATG